jgi:hypothetical protein
VSYSFSVSLAGNEVFPPSKETPFWLFYNIVTLSGYHARHIACLLQPRCATRGLWLAFVDTIEDMITGGWGPLYRAAHVKVRFIFNQKDTRERLYRDIQNTNDFMKKRSLKRTWAVGVADSQGLFEFVRSCVME